MDEDIPVSKISTNKANTAENEHEQEAWENTENKLEESLTSTFLNCMPWMNRSMKPKQTFENYLSSLQSGLLAPTDIKLLHPSENQTQSQHMIQTK